MDEDFTKDEEEKIVELMGKHSLRTSEKQRPKMATANKGVALVLLHSTAHKRSYKFLVAILSAQKCSTLFVWSFSLPNRPMAYPVLQDGNQQRYHEPLDFKIVKALAESVHTYGVTVGFTISQVEALNRFCMTPGNWMNLVRACLSPGQYLDWRAVSIICCRSSHPFKGGVSKDQMYPLYG